MKILKPWCTKHHCEVVSEIDGGSQFAMYCPEGRREYDRWLQNTRAQIDDGQLSGSALYSVRVVVCKIEYRIEEIE